MFERYWKPHFDNWSQKTGDWLEEVFRTPVVLKGISSSLQTVFYGKIALDRVQDFCLTTLGVSTNRDQKKVLHLLLRLSAQVEDLIESQRELQRDQEGTREQTETELEALRGEVEALAARLAALQASREQELHPAAIVHKETIPTRQTTEE